MADGGWRWWRLAWEVSLNRSNGHELSEGIEVSKGTYEDEKVGVKIWRGKPPELKAMEMNL